MSQTTNLEDIVEAIQTMTDQNPLVIREILDCYHDFIAEAVIVHNDPIQIENFGMFYFSNVTRQDRWFTNGRMQFSDQTSTTDYHKKKEERKKALLETYKERELNKI